VEKHKIGSNIILHYSTVSGCYYSRDHFVFFYNYSSRKSQIICRIPPLGSDFFSKLKDLIARNGIYHRIKRTPGLWHLIVDNIGRIVVIYDKVYFFDPGKSTKYMAPLQQKDARKFEPPMRGGCAVHYLSNNIYFGEYINCRSKNVRIFKIDTELMNVSCCYEFDVGEIKHIHAICYDKYRNRLWITTGDNDKESAFYYTDDEFKSVHYFAGGDQSWRALGLIFDEYGFEWGMDAGKDASEDEINRIYRFDFRDNQRTELAVIGNPAYYVAQAVDGTAWLSTTYEPGTPQNTPMQATLWYRNRFGTWKTFDSFEYIPCTQHGISQYAQILLPYGVLPSNIVCFTPINAEFHYSTFVVNIKDMKE